MATESPEPVELTSITLKSVIRLKEEEVENGEQASLGKRGRKTLRQRREKLSHLMGENSGRARMFGVTCNFGTDDFFFLPLFGVAIRATWYVNQ